MIFGGGGQCVVRAPYAALLAPLVTRGTLAPAWPVSESQSRTTVVPLRYVYEYILKMQSLCIDVIIFITIIVIVPIIVDIIIITTITMSVIILMCLHLRLKEVLLK